MAAGLIAGVPVAWVLGLDQLVWLLGGALLGAHLLGRRDAPRLLLVLVGLFLVIAAVSGVLSAEGVRWATLARDLAIALSFFATLFGIAALVASNRSVRWIVAAVTLVLSISSVLSIIVFVIQDPLRFTTPIAPLVPEWIARTVLGATSLTSRSLGTPSYLFGTEFLRPNGLFLFSTSQAVAQATFLPMMVAAARTHREWRWWFVAAIGVNVVGLVLTTTRASIAAVIVGLALVWFIRRWMVGYVRVEIPLNRRSAPVLAGILLLFVVGAVGIGATGPLVDFVTARSGDSRGTLYDATIAWWREKPILGWGTVVDNVPTPTPVSSATPTPRVSPTPRPTPTPVPTPVVTPRPLTPEELPPLGSHSQYLGVLFKQGVVGIVLFLAVVAVTARYAWALLRRPRPGSDLVVAAFVSSLVAGITEEFWLDPGAALAVGIVWGLVVAGGRRALARRAENPIPDQSESPILT